MFRTELQHNMADTEEEKKVVFINKESIDKVLKLILEVVEDLCEWYLLERRGASEERTKRIKGAEEEVVKVRNTSIKLIHMEPCISLCYLALSLNPTGEHSNIYSRARKLESTFDDYSVLRKCLKHARKSKQIVHPLIKETEQLLLGISSTSFEQIKRTSEAYERLLN